MENIRGIGLMVLAMAGFALADMFIKSVSSHIPVGEILLFIGTGGTLFFAAMAGRNGEAVVSRDLFSGLILLRTLGEMAGTFGFVTALVLIPISTASAILQATPLAVTLGAALFMGEAVGWRRVSAIVVGFVGVLIIIRPGLEAFQPASLFAVLAVAGLSLRDLATRAAPRGFSTLRLGTYGFAALVPTGAVLLLLGEPLVLPDPGEWLFLALALMFDMAGYHALTHAMRMGDVAIVTPFRYARLLFAIIIGILVFGERLDLATIAGSLIVILSGLYTFAREHRQRLRSRPLP
ncbi:MAG: DMT family transporter [Rhodobacteraceae bacterium]|nr:DMT family transporter [Paracoccaceae bacterium]